MYNSFKSYTHVSVSFHLPSVIQAGNIDPLPRPAPAAGRALETGTFRGGGCTCGTAVGAGAGAGAAPPTTPPCVVIHAGSIDPRPRPRLARGCVERGAAVGCATAAAAAAADDLDVLDRAEESKLLKAWTSRPPLLPPGCTRTGAR